MVTSLETLDEAGRGDAQMAAQRLAFLGAMPLLAMTNEAIDLATKLVSEGIVPAKAASDAIHIAVASAHEVDYLVTWNFKHVANPFYLIELGKRLQKQDFRCR